MFAPTNKKRFGKSEPFLLFVLFYANGKATFALNKSPSIDKSSVAF